MFTCLKSLTALQMVLSEHQLLARPIHNKKSSLITETALFKKDCQIRSQIIYRFRFFVLPVYRALFSFLILSAIMQARIPINAAQAR